MARESLSTEALVLRTVPYRDSDLIVMLYTRERGRLSALARGARKSTRRFGGALQLFTVSRAELTTRGGDLFTLASAQPTTSYASLATDMACFAHASYGTELVRELTPLEVPEEAIFELLHHLYQTLSERGALTSVLRAFELHILYLLGLAPVLERCVGCGAEELAGRGLILDPNRGGVCCATCAAMSRGAGVRPISPGALELLQEIGRTSSLDEAANLAAHPPDHASEARDALVAVLLGHLGKPLRSLEFIAKVSGSIRKHEG